MTFLKTLPVLCFYHALCVGANKCVSYPACYICMYTGQDNTSLEGQSVGTAYSNVACHAFSDNILLHSKYCTELSSLSYFCYAKKSQEFLYLQQLRHLSKLSRKYFFPKSSYIITCTMYIVQQDELPFYVKQCPQ